MPRPIATHAATPLGVAVFISPHRHTTFSGSHCIWGNDPMVVKVTKNVLDQHEA